MLPVFRSITTEKGLQRQKNHDVEAWTPSLVFISLSLLPVLCVCLFILCSRSVLPFCPVALLAPLGDPMRLRMVNLLRRKLVFVYEVLEVFRVLYLVAFCICLFFFESVSSFLNVLRRRSHPPLALLFRVRAFDLRVFVLLVLCGTPYICFRIYCYVFVLNRVGAEVVNTGYQMF